MRNTPHTGRRLAVGVTSTVLLGLIGLIGLSACASDSKSSSATPTAAATAGAVDAGAEQPASTAAAAVKPDGNVSLGSGGVAPPDGATGVALTDGSPFGTALAITAGVTIEVVDVRETVIALPQLVTDKGGAIFDSDIAVGDPESATATVVIKVPPDDMESLISGLGGLGELVGRTQQTEDVADQIADITARTQTAQASVDRVRKLLDEAVTLDDVVRIEGELTVRETALEQLLASQRNLADRVQLATLTVVITPAGEPAVAAVRKSTGIGDAFAKGWSTFTDVLHRGVVVLAYSAPLLVIALVAGLVAWLLRRRVQRAPQPAPHVAGPTA